MFSKTTLKNGLRIITIPAKNTEAVTVLVLVGTGSKYEEKEQNGISHFLEHLFFKGTKRRPSPLKVAETLDKVGGVYNAFTSKEYTGYFAKVHSSYLNLALDWVSDIFLNSKLEEKEIEKEKGVIIEEANMYHDTPVKYINDLWEKLLYGDQPAGWEVIGEKENILKFKREDFLKYLKEHYCSQNTVVAIAGNFNQKEALNKIKNYFQGISSRFPKNKKEVIEKQEKPALSLHFKETDQTHFCLGVRGYDLFDEKRYAQEILAVILGGNMSSRLFISVREKSGLAYYIHTDCETYTDTGYLVTQAGVPHEKLKKAIKLILKEYRRIKEKGVSSQELRKAKDYLKGNTVLAFETSEVKASFFAEQELLKGEILTLQEKFAKIDKITKKDIKEAAQELFQNSKLNLVVIGPHKDEKEFRNMLTLE